MCEDKNLRKITFHFVYSFWCVCVCIPNCLNIFRCENIGSSPVLYLETVSGVFGGGTHDGSSIQGRNEYVLLTGLKISLVE